MNQPSRKIQLCADSGNRRGFYAVVKAAYRPIHHAQNSPTSADGQTLLTDKTASLLNQSGPKISKLFSMPTVTTGEILKIRKLERKSVRIVLSSVELRRGEKFSSLTLLEILRIVLK
ncbi:hypothetical protein LOAG_07951 [Loa loa]|uniref:Uncharacterized protein n=1 Tax=Loa loa TaxID=7209 RepID=A0A1S0TWE1_LOALO|nr:hypothetical protein LOAG_07951 [Loa loa]EFO20536.1 hypothetical protein LOAG_07951 [Loa loa]